MWEEELIEEVGVTGEVIAARESRAAAKGMRGNSSSPLRRTQSLSSGSRDVIGSFSVEPVSYGKNSKVLGRVPTNVTHRASNGFFSELQARSSEFGKAAKDINDRYLNHIEAAWSKSEEILISRLTYPIPVNILADFAKLNYEEALSKKFGLFSKIESYLRNNDSINWHGEGITLPELNLRWKKFIKSKDRVTRAEECIRPIIDELSEFNRIIINHK